MNATARRRTSLFLTAAVVAALTLQVLRPAPAHAGWLGKRGVIVFVAPTAKGDKSSIWFMTGEGTDLVEMTPGDGRNDFDPMFSPEGGPHVVYVGRPLKGGPGDLFVIDRYPPGGGLPKPINLTAKLAGDSEHPAFSPSGGKIAFDLTVPGKPPHIWTTSLSRLNKQMLTCCRDHQLNDGPINQPIVGTQPAWSPDSKTIAYVAPDPQNPTVNGIWLAAYDRNRLPVFLTDGEQPNWSPLGDMLVYTLGGNLMVARPDPTNPRPTLITREPKGVIDTAPAWTPDSTHLPSYQESPGSVLFERDGRVYIVGASPVNGSKQPHAVSPAGIDAGAPDWQPRCMNDKVHDGVVIRGTAGPDLLCGGRGNDTIYGYGGWDHIYAGQGHDHVYAGPGNDFVLGGVGTDGDVIDGGPGDDHLEGGLGPDVITDYGKDSGSDFITAGGANDRIEAWDGVLGNDRIDGGDQTDTCVVDNTDLGHSQGVDFIWQCEHATLPKQVG